jgi:hypothetical protein
MLGRFKRRVYAPFTLVKPTVRKFLQVFDRTVKEVDRLKAPCGTASHPRNPRNEMARQSFSAFGRCR